MKKQMEIGATHNLPKKESSPQKLEYTHVFFQDRNIGCNDRGSKGHGSDK